MRGTSDYSEPYKSATRFTMDTSAYNVGLFLKGRAMDIIEKTAFTRPPGIEHFVLGPDNLNIWYSRLKLLFSISVEIDGQEDAVDIKCAYVSFCYEIRQEPSGMY